MPVEIIKQLSVTFRGLKLWNYYGQTEMGPVATILKPEDQLLKPGSAGKPVLNVETRLMDDDGNFVPLGTVGEIVHRSGHVMTDTSTIPRKRKMPSALAGSIAATLAGSTRTGIFMWWTARRT